MNDPNSVWCKNSSAAPSGIHQLLGHGLQLCLIGIGVFSKQFCSTMRVLNTAGSR